MYIFLEQITEFYCYVMAIHFFSKISLNQKKKRYLLILIVAIILSVVVEKNNIQWLKVIGWMIFQLLSIFLVIDSSIKEKILGSVGCFCLIGLFNVIVTLVMDIVHPVKIWEFDYAWSICFIIICLVGIILKKIGCNKKIRRIKVPWFVYIIFFIIAVILAGLLMCNYIYRQEVRSIKSNVTTAVTLLNVMVCIGLMLALFLGGTLFQQYKEKLQLSLKYRELRENYYKKIVSNNEELKEFKHDINHHLNSVQFLLNQKKYNEAEHYLQEISKRFMEIGDLEYKCDNDVVDSVLSEVLPKMKEKNIRFCLRYDIYKEICINEVDFSTILYNLIENAVEACENEEEKKIELNVKQIQNNIFISISNSVEKTFSMQRIKNRKTEKENNAEHGFGIKNVEKCIEKYNGEMKYTYENGMVQCNIILFQAVK